MSGAAGAGTTGAGMKTATTTVSWIQEEKEEAAWTYCSRGCKKEKKKNKRLLWSRKRRKIWWLFVSLACHIAGLLYSSRFTHHEAKGSNMTGSTLHRTTCQHWGSICEGKEMTEPVWYKQAS